MGDGLLGFSIGQSWKTSQRRPSFSEADVGTPGKTWEKLELSELCDLDKLAYL